MSDRGSVADMEEENCKDSVAALATKETDIDYSRKPSLYIMLVLLGCASFVCWNFVIQTLPFILLQKLNRPELNNLFLGL